jgi:hypothetical protein
MNSPEAFARSLFRVAAAFNLVTAHDQFQELVVVKSREELYKLTFLFIHKIETKMKLPYGNYVQVNMERAEAFNFSEYLAEFKLKIESEELSILIDVLIPRVSEFIKFCDGRKQATLSSKDQHDLEELIIKSLGYLTMKRTMGGPIVHLEHEFKSLVKNTVGLTTGNLNLKEVSPVTLKDAPIYNESIRLFGFSQIKQALKKGPLKGHHLDKNLNHRNFYPFITKVFDLKCTEGYIRNSLSPSRYGKDGSGYVYANEAIKLSTEFLEKYNEHMLIQLDYN